MNTSEVAQALLEMGVPVPEDLTVEPAGLSEDEVAHELAQDIKSAINFIESELVPLWEKAEAYYNGETDIPIVKGRSRATSTQVRDAIRAAKPSLLRVFLSTSSIVEFVPPSAEYGALAEQQSLFVNQRFFDAGGFGILRDAIHNAMLKKFSIVKWWKEDVISHSTFSLTSVPADEAEAIAAREDVTILQQEQRDFNGLPVFDLEVRYTKREPSIKLGFVPLHEFFIDENATSFDDFRVTGHRRTMYVADAVVELGLPFEVVSELDAIDPETHMAAGESEKRRGYIKTPNLGSVDDSRKQVLITEAYARFDMDGSGELQLYRFILGGSNYELLAYEEVEDVQMAKLDIDPQPGTFAGTSTFDVLKPEQDVTTSLLRATVDNAHASNNRRLAVNETLVNLDDVLSTSIGAPIRFRGQAQSAIHEVGVQSTIGTMLPLLQFLQDNTERKSGVATAATGLDPDALQSTNADAVRNTIQLSQGQIEFMARNLTEGLTRVFRGLLVLSMRHFPAEQYMQYYGKVIAINQGRFSPEWTMRPAVGLGSGNTEIRRAGLMHTLAQQEKIIATLGPGNPLVGLTEIYNTQVDLLKTFSLYNSSRYFKPVTPEIEQEYMQKMAEAEANKPPTIDPGTAMIEAERLKAEQRREEAMLKAMLDARQIAIEAELEALRYAADDDFQRDKLYQEFKLRNAMTRGKFGVEANEEKVMAAQNADRKQPYTPPKGA